MRNDPIAFQAERGILVIRRQRVRLDHDLATLYGVETRAHRLALPPFRSNLTPYA